VPSPATEFPSPIGLRHEKDLTPTHRHSRRSPPPGKLRTSRGRTGEGTQPLRLGIRKGYIAQRLAGWRGPCTRSLTMNRGCSSTAMGRSHRVVVVMLSALGLLFGAVGPCCVNDLPGCPVGECCERGADHEPRVEGASHHGSPRAAIAEACCDAASSQLREGTLTVARVGHPGMSTQGPAQQAAPSAPMLTAGRATPHVSPTRAPTILRV
jgi:hypothetical protein